MFQDYQICDGFNELINGAVYGVQEIWYASLYTGYWGFLLVVANNSFNDINRIGMFLTVRHLWPFGACFVFKCYRHCSSLFLRNGNGESIFLRSREVVTQEGGGCCCGLQNWSYPADQMSEIGVSWRHVDLLCRQLWCT